MKQDLYSELLDAGQGVELSRVMDSGFCDIDPSFLGFTEIYKHLAAIVPDGRTVIDFGSAYAFQGWYFRSHRAYISVNPGDGEQFRVANGSYFRMTTSEYIKQHGNERDPRTVFAICNYVPPWHGEDSLETVRKFYPHVFTFYPEHGDHPELDVKMKRLFTKPVDFPTPPCTDEVASGVEGAKEKENADD